MGRRPGAPGLARRGQRCRSRSHRRWRARLGQRDGPHVGTVVPGSPARLAGIGLHDVIVTADGNPSEDVQTPLGLMPGRAIGTRSR